MSLWYTTYTDLNWHAQLLRLEIFGIGNYEHLIYYLDNENKSLPECVQAIMVENETLAHLRHCQDSSEVNPPLALKPPGGYSDIFTHT